MGNDGKDNVVFLAFSNPALDADTVRLTACRLCKNKAFSLVYAGDQDDQYPVLRCTACNNACGKVGWVNE